MAIAVKQKAHLEVVPDKGKVKKPNKRRRLSKEPRITDRVKIACQNPLAVVMGTFAAFIPLAIYSTVHYDFQGSTWKMIGIYGLVLGGLIFSAKTVYDWGKEMFQFKPKAVGFVLLLECVMVVSGIQWLAITSLGILMFINGISTACNLSEK